MAQHFEANWTHWLRSGKAPPNKFLAVHAPDAILGGEERIDPEREELVSAPRDLVAEPVGGLGNPALAHAQGSRTRP